MIVLLAFLAFASLDVSDIDSVMLGGTCLAKGMRLQDVVARFEKNPSWEFRWDEKMVTKTGMVAGILPRNRAETPFLLQFAFLTKKPMGDAVLLRIGWGGKQEQAGTIAKLVGCKKGS